MFLVSGVAKIRTREQFALQLMALRVVSPGVCRVLARIVPLGELAVGVLLLTGMFGLAAALANLAVMLVFTGYVAWILATGRTAACFCFGESREPTSRTTLHRNLGLVGAALLLVVGELVSAAPHGVAVHVLGMVHGLTALCLFLAAMELIAVAKPQAVPQ
jgi:uncharacterized membrane protein YphA (DoxX/SURF4 family)